MIICDSHSSCVFLADRRQAPVMPSHLMQTRLQIYNASKCHYRVYNEQQQICAGGSDMGSTGICGGDSGGPLVKQVNEKWTLFGITSYSHKFQCAHSSFADGFTRLQYYRNWIYEK